MFTRGGACPHQRMDPVDVEHRRPAGPVFGPRSPWETVVLRRCPRCGDLDTITLDGNWTLAQVHGHPAPEPEPEPPVKVPLEAEP